MIYTTIKKAAFWGKLGGIKCLLWINYSGDIDNVYCIVHIFVQSLRVKCSIKDDYITSI